MCGSNRSGRLIVELLDYRSNNRSKAHVDNPEPHRVILHSNDETKWADAMLLNAKHNCKWTDRDLMQIEAAIIVRIFLSQINSS